MSFTQLNPPLPVFAVGKGEGAFAHGVIDYGPEHDLIWVTAIDATGEIWCVPNPKLRMQRNWTMGRPAPSANGAMTDSDDKGAMKKFAPNVNRL